MSDEYEDDFCEEGLPSPKAALKAASTPTRPSAAVRQPTLGVSTLKASYSSPMQPRHAEMLSPAHAAAAAMTATRSNGSAAAASSSSSTSSAADAARIRELEAKLELVEKEVMASRVKLRRAGRGGPGAAEADAGAGGDASASCSSGVGSNVARELAFSSVTLGEQISGGGFCLLYKSKWCGLDVAVKRMFDPSMTAAMRAEFAREVRMLANLSHPHIVQLIGACSQPPNLCIVTEFLPRGSLFHVLHSSAVDMTRARKAKMGLELAHALHFLQNCGVIHRDIKSHNALADEYVKVKICDFGMARHVSELSGSDNGGTPNYMSPELFQGQQASFASDMYAYGILLNEIWSRAVPWEGAADVADIRRKVIMGERPKVAPTVPREVVQLIKECTAQTPAQRPQSYAKIIQTLTAIAAQPAA